jgi:hypothetical protein
MKLRAFGLLEHDPARATPGFTLYSPLAAPEAYLLDMQGRVVHEWRLPGKNSDHVLLLPSGNLLAAVQADPNEHRHREARRLIVEHDWEGRRVWQCEAPAQHHDFQRLPNGNTLFLGFERFTEESKRRLRGGLPGSEMADGGVLGDYIHEVAPDGKVVWEWHAQHDMEIERYPIHAFNVREEFSHANSLFALPDGDILVSFRRSSWLFIIDRKTRKVRWERQDEQWGGQHNAQRLPNGNLLFFANGVYASNRAVPYSRVIEMDPQTAREVWSYKGSPPWSFFSPHISGAQRLWSGNTLICEGLWGRIFEVTTAGDIVWEYVNPHQHPQHGGGGGLGNWVFRALRYAPDSPEIGARVRL